MTYSANSDFKQVNFLVRAKVKLGKLLTKYFPLNSVRILGLKMSGFTIGEKVYIGEDLIVASIISEKSCNLIIGDRVAIAPRVTLLLSSDANWSKLMEIFGHKKGQIILDDDCWLGAGVIIMPNIKIGKCSVVGSGAVVTKDVEPYSIVAGIPAKKIDTVRKSGT